MTFSKQSIKSNACKRSLKIWVNDFSLSLHSPDRGFHKYNLKQLEFSGVIRFANRHNSKDPDLTHSTENAWQYLKKGMHPVPTIPAVQLFLKQWVELLGELPVREDGITLFWKPVEEHIIFLLTMLADGMKNLVITDISVFQHLNSVRTSNWIDYKPFLWNANIYIVITSEWNPFEGFLDKLYIK